MTAQRTTSQKGKTIHVPAALAQTPFDLFAPVYRAAAQHGIDALTIDEMEPWQVASTLGVDMDGDDTGPGGSDTPPPPGSLSRGRRRPS